MYATGCFQDVPPVKPVSSRRVPRMWYKRNPAAAGCCWRGEGAERGFLFTTYYKYVGMYAIIAMQRRYWLPCGALDSPLCRDSKGTLDALRAQVMMVMMLMMTQTCGVDRGSTEVHDPRSCSAAYSSVLRDKDPSFSKAPSHLTVLLLYNRVDLLLTVPTE